MGRDQVYSVTDLQRVTPALEVSQTSGGEVNGGARLRGLGTGVFNASVSPSVAFIVDQVPQGNLTFPILRRVSGACVRKPPVQEPAGPTRWSMGKAALGGFWRVSAAAAEVQLLTRSTWLRAVSNCEWR